MKDTTVKLSGHSKDQFLDRFFAAEPDLDAQVRQRLINRCKAAFSSVRVRKATLSGLRQTAGKQRAKFQRAKIQPADKLPGATLPRPAAPPEPQLTLTATAAATPSPAPVDRAEPQSPETAFDAYAIGLVPVFQREGRDGLLAKLAAVENIDHLRQMAKAQQIVLPPPLRLGEATAEAIRDGIADSVAKRIADRKAAAG